MATTVRMMMVVVVRVVRVSVAVVRLRLLLLLRGIAAADGVLLAAVAGRVLAAAAVGSVEFMLLGGMLLDVHHVQILLVVVLEGRRLGHVGVGRLHHLGRHAHHLVVRRLLLVGRRVRGRTGRRWRRLRAWVVLLVGLAGRGRRRGRRRGRGGRRQVLDLRRLGRLVDPVRLE